MKNILENNALWERAYQIGIDKRMLERKGYLDILVAGDETPEMDLRLNVDDMIIWITATLKLVPGNDGEMEIAVNGKIVEQEDDDDDEE